MGLFDPVLMECCTEGCKKSFYQKPHTNRKYCDDCRGIRKRQNWQRKMENMKRKGQFKQKESE